jgi:hypothetical protein
MGTIFGFAFTSAVPPPSGHNNLVLAAAAYTEIPITFVQMDEDNGYTVFEGIPGLIPFAAYIDTHRFHEHYVRRQLPLEAAHTSTIHKAQGATAIFGGVVEPSPHESSHVKIEYVGVSRMKCLEHLLHLAALSANHFAGEKWGKQRQKIRREYDTGRSHSTLKYIYCTFCGKVPNSCKRYCIEHTDERRARGTSDYDATD